MTDPFKIDMTNASLVTQELVARYSIYKALLSEIVATLNLPGNARFFAEFPSHWHDLVEYWTNTAKTNGVLEDYTVVIEIQE